MLLQPLGIRLRIVSVFVDYHIAALNGFREVVAVFIVGRTRPKNYSSIHKVSSSTQRQPVIIGQYALAGQQISNQAGWGHAIYTSWTMLADREGFICVFPDAHQARIWQVASTCHNRPVRPGRPADLESSWPCWQTTLQSDR